MISLDPAKRLSCDEYLTKFRGTAFPNIFYDFLHPFISTQNETSSAANPPTPPPATPSSSIRPPPTVAGGAVMPELGRGGSTLRSGADEVIDALASEWHTITTHLDESAGPSKPEDRRPEAAETSKAGQVSQLKESPANPFVDALLGYVRSRCSPSS